MHPAIHGVEADEFVKLRLVGSDGIGICFRHRYDEIPVEFLSPRPGVVAGSQLSMVAGEGNHRQLTLPPIAV